jgi:hypothetical protein
MHAYRFRLLVRRRSPALCWLCTLILLAALLPVPAAPASAAGSWYVQDGGSCP